MPAKDLFHENVKAALVKDGWKITNDPLALKIAVEIKSFVSVSEVKDLENALGQYFLYLIVLCEKEPKRKLYLAVTEEIFLDFFHEKDLGGLVTKGYNLSIIVFNPIKEEIVQWIN